MKSSIISTKSFVLCHKPKTLTLITLVWAVTLTSMPSYINISAVRLLKKNLINYSIYNKLIRLITF